MLYQKEADQGLTYFLALLFAPKNRNRFPFFLSSGLIYQGIGSRSLDSISCGIAYGSYSSDLRHVQKIACSTRTTSPFGNHPQTTETVLEVNYWFQVNKWFALTPDMQYIINPKGYGSTKNALVLGMQVTIEI